MFDIDDSYEFKHLDRELIKKGFNGLGVFQRNSILVSLSEKLKPRDEFGRDLDITEEQVMAYHKDLKTLSLKRKCESEILEGFISSNGHHYRTNRDDQINMIGQKDILLENETINEVMWKTEDSGYVKHTRNDWLEMYNEAFKHKQEKLFRYDKLKQLVRDAKSDEEITAITWETELP